MTSSLSVNSLSDGDTCGVTMPPRCSSGPPLPCNLSRLNTGLQCSIRRQSGPGRSRQRFSSTLLISTNINCPAAVSWKPTLWISITSIVTWHTVKWKVKLFALVFSQSIIAGWSINCTVPAQYEASINISVSFFIYCKYFRHRNDQCDVAHNTKSMLGMMGRLAGTWFVKWSQRWESVRVCKLHRPSAGS